MPPGARFSKVPETFRARKPIAKSRTLRLQRCFIHVFLIWTEVPFIQEVSGVYTSPFVDTDELKMALRARKVSGAFEKRGPARLLRSRFLMEKRPIFLVDPNFRNFLTGSLLTKYRIYDFHNWTSPEGSYGYRRFWNTLQNLTTFFLCTTVPNKLWVWSECPRLVVSFSHASLYLQSPLKHRRLGISGILGRANRASLVYQCF